MLRLTLSGVSVLMLLCLAAARWVGPELPEGPLVFAALVLLFASTLERRDAQATQTLRSEARASGTLGGESPAVVVITAECWCAEVRSEVAEAAGLHHQARPDLQVAWLQSTDDRRGSHHPPQPRRQRRRGQPAGALPQPPQLQDGDRRRGLRPSTPPPAQGEGGVGF